MSNNEQTHYEGCFKAQGHHDCAVTAIERLQAKVALLDLSPAQHNVLERMFVAEAERDDLKAKLLDAGMDAAKAHKRVAELEKQLAAVTQELDAIRCPNCGAATKYVLRQKL